MAIVDEPDEPPHASGVIGCATPSETIPPDINTLQAKWNDWRWQLRHRIRQFDELQHMFPALNGMSTDMAARKFPMAITPYYASLIQSADPSDPIFAQSVPQACELIDPPCLRDDPLEEDHDMPVPNLVHRYGDRALLLVTSMCSVYCRHCTRKRVAGQRESRLSPIDLVRAVDYLGTHPEIKDVVISGGDPLTLSTAALERIVSAIRAVPSVEIIRIGTRTPVVLPMRVTADLVRMLRKYHPIYINTHFNHPRELTPEAMAACHRLADVGIPLGNQSVLLRGVNDDSRVLEELFRGLVRNRVRPYYLFQCDLVRGVEHFRTPLSKGIEIMEHLRGRLSGLAIPTFTVDMPHGGGKVPLLPNYMVSMSPTHTVLRNFEGMLVAYPEPNVQAPSPEPMDRPAIVADLAAGRASHITPMTSRHGRRAAGTESRRLPEVNE